MIVLTWVLVGAFFVLGIPAAFGVLRGLFSEFDPNWKPQGWDEEEIDKRIEKNTNWDND